MEIHFQDGNKKTGRSMDQESIPELMESSKSEKNSTIISRDWMKISSPRQRMMFRTQVSRRIRRKDGQMQEKGESPPQQLPPQPQHLPPPGLVAATSSNLENNSMITSTNDNNSLLVAAKSSSSRGLARWTEQVRDAISSNVTDIPADDGYLWRKYGQKDILGSSYPRHYYRCINRHSGGCLATKQVQRESDDPTMFVVTYRGKHSCHLSPPETQEKGESPPQQLLPQPQQLPPPGATQ